MYYQSNCLNSTYGSNAVILSCLINVSHKIMIVFIFES